MHKKCTVPRTHCCHPINFLKNIYLLTPVRFPINRSVDFFLLPILNKPVLLQSIHDLNLTFPFLESISLHSLSFCLVGARTDEEDSPISCGRFFLTYYFLFCIFSPSRSKFLSSINFLSSKIREYPATRGIFSKGSQRGKGK